MIYINVDRVFAEDWEDTIAILTTTAMGKAILDIFVDDVVYLSGGVIITPPEEYSEAIEAGIGDITDALNS